MTHRNPPNATAGGDPLFVSVKEAARRLNLAPYTVYELCKVGTLESGKSGSRRLVSVASVMEYADAVLRGDHAKTDRAS